MHRLLLLTLLALVALPARAQPEGVLRGGDDLHRFLLRQQAAGALRGAPLAHRPLSAYQARALLDTLAAHDARLSPLDRALLAQYRGTEPAPGARWLRRRAPFLYPDGQTFFAATGDGYTLHVEPLLYLAYAPARRRTFADEAAPVAVWRNTRGVRAAGHLGRYLFFESRVEETQEHVPFPERRQNTAPRLPFVRASGDAYDYQLATGLIGLRTRFVEVRFGRDRNVWGPGATSLVLSDYAAPYDALQLRTTVWRLQYVNLFAALHDLTPLPEGVDSQVLPRKYASFHHLSIDLGRRVEVGLFQGVIFATDTTAAPRRSNYDVSYLNPVVFLRAAEADRGSGDNVLLGADAAVGVGPGRIYGQLILDEFRASEIGRRWWANKWGWLVGGEVANVGGTASHLRLEFARLRPYLYSHGTPINAYTHFNDLLGHPAGPNTVSVLATADVRLTRRVPATFAFLHVLRGRDTPAENWGADPLRSYNTRVQDRDVRLLQGVRVRSIQAEGSVSYEWLPGLHTGVGVRALYEDDATRGRRGYLAPTVLLRWGMPYAFTAL